MFFSVEIFLCILLNCTHLSSSFLFDVVLR
uniref:Uncharacterized protein n=1 Tax=Anguilla anguilla TaxID=7936 RepID=A0A0E9U7J4_ANGAN